MKEEDEEVLLIYIINIVMQKIQNDSITKIDSNMIHFMAYDLIQQHNDLKELYATAWYIHGPYVPMVDDILVKHFGMDPKYHQLKSKSKERFDFIETEYESVGK